ncbi:GPN-loop GTPase [Enteropsectra breve]|nr:GPN-loop GTPase [Enteropsectra breve]
MEKRAFVVVGMAGSGKTTFCQRLYTWLNTEIVLKNGLNSLITSINLDPAVENPKMPLTTDIRDFIDYRETMQKYRLGPNGCINTCLNIFLLNYEKQEQAKYTIIDTPGQIEAFTWSSPGDAVMDLFSDICILYVIDLSICKNKHVFMTNMIFAAALKAKFRRPLLVVFNKNDMEGLDEVSQWIVDFEAFRNSLNTEEIDLGSMALYFEEFYNSIDFVSVSAYTGSGKEDFLKKVDEIYQKKNETKP